VTRKHRRLVIVLVGLLLVGGAAALVLMALRENIIFFHAPSDIAADRPAAGRAIRLGGIVEEGSIEREADGLTVRFRVTDFEHAIPVVYKGILPDLFREGQGVVAEGSLGEDGLFQASEVLAKHDENYMPPEVADALKKAGRWQHYKDGAGGDGAEEESSY
jgi:cytochrome c-type biogenesis protein CcmE